MAHCWWGNFLFLLVEFSHLPVHVELLSGFLLGLGLLKGSHLTFSRSLRLLLLFLDGIKFSDEGFALSLHFVCGDSSFDFSELAD